MNKVITPEEIEKVQRITGKFNGLLLSPAFDQASKHNVDHQLINAMASIFHGRRLSTNRTGISTLHTAAKQIVVNGTTVPRLLGKYVNPRLAYTEMLWMVSGRNDLKWLQDHKVNYWNNWSDENGTIGKSYGYQFGKQIESLVEGLISNWDSRRHIINLWQFDDLNEMVLPPCVYGYQWVTMGDTLITDGGLAGPLSGPIEKETKRVNLVVNCRSCDVFLGGPYDIMFAYFLNKLVIDYVSAKTGVQIETDSIIFNMGDCHVYLNQLDSIDKYLDNVKTLIDGIELIDVEGLDTPRNTIRDKVGSNAAGETCYTDIQPGLTQTLFNGPECKSTYSFQYWIEANIYFLEDCLSKYLNWNEFCYTKNTWCEENIDELRFLRIETPVAI